MEGGGGQSPTSAVNGAKAHHPIKLSILCVLAVSTLHDTYCIRKLYSFTADNFSQIESNMRTVVIVYSKMIFHNGKNIKIGQHNCSPSSVFSELVRQQSFGKVSYHIVSILFTLNRNM